ncbi:hypothetical protein BGW80DRAFT_1148227, partial [Lactifluus volemus]
IGLLHEDSKQEFGHDLVITGFLVSLSAMTISLDNEWHAALVMAVHEFALHEPESGWQHKLHKWLHLLGWISWALNVCPLLWPALSSRYAKTAGKMIPHVPVFLNSEVITNLVWFATTFNRFSSVHILQSIHW